jgi:hypothetical protein
VKDKPPFGGPEKKRRVEVPSTRISSVLVEVPSSGRGGVTFLFDEMERAVSKRGIEP